MVSISSLDMKFGRLPGIEPELSVPQTDALTVVL